MTHVTRRLTAKNRDQLRNPIRSVIEYGLPFTFFIVTSLMPAVSAVGHSRTSYCVTNLRRYAVCTDEPLTIMNDDCAWAVVRGLIDECCWPRFDTIITLLSLRRVACRRHHRRQSSVHDTIRYDKKEKVKVAHTRLPSVGFRS